MHQPQKLVARPRVRWLVGAAVPAAVCYAAGGLVAGYVDGFIVKPNELVRERPYISHNIEMTRRAYGLDRITQRPFAADTGVDGRYTSWFISFAPADHPRVAVAVVLQDQTGFGGQVAAPIAKSVMQAILAGKSNP